MLREDDDLTLPPFRVLHLGIVLKDFGKLAPLAVLARGHDRLRLLLQSAEVEQERKVDPLRLAR